MVYHQIKKELENQGVIFKSIEAGLRENEDLFRQYFGTVIPAQDNKYAALNAAVCRRLVYLRPARRQDRNAVASLFSPQRGQHRPVERTMIIVDEGAFLHYVEGCTAPTYTTSSLHSGVIEIVVKKGARSRYSTIQNWSDNVYNLVTQRAMVYGDASHEWVDANLGSKVTMKYPSVYLMEPGAHGEVLSIAFADAVRLRTPAARSSTSPAHHQPDHQQIDLQGWRARQLPRPAQGLPGRRRG